MPSLFCYGALAPLDPITGAVAGLPWQADRCATASKNVDAEVTQHPRELVTGGGLPPATDARLERGSGYPVEFYLSDAGSELHPVPPSEGRAARLALEFEALARDGRLLQAWIQDMNGNAPVKDVLVGPYTVTKDTENKVVTISTTLTVITFADVAEGSLIVDADLAAAGLP